MNITSLLMRRSLGRTLFPVFLVLVLLNTLLRSMNWRYEWMWAVYQYNFTVVLLGPLLAGVAGWEGYRLARSRHFLSSHHRPIAMLTSAWAALFAWCALAFLLGLGVVFAITAAAGTPQWPGLRGLLTPIPALALLALECAGGLAAGWLSHSRLAAPLAAIVVFLATLLLYTSSFSVFVTVGGATGSLIGLRPKLGTQMAQSLFFTLATLLALFVGAWLASWYRSPRWPVMALVCALTIGSAVYATSRDHLYLEARSGDVVCSGKAPEICLGRSYTRFEPQLRAHLTPYNKALASIGVTAPATYRQDATSTGRDLGQLDLATVTGKTDALVDMVLGTYYGSRCEIRPGSAMEKNYTNARFWLAQSVGAETYDDRGVDPVIVKGTVPERTKAAHAAFAGLMACHG
ncbi:hypothetical protein [Streptomyces longhuiensis]|uniref:hypothetical protein n=1 Tax=Streptomyces longhuiensis TaxID=2880933 RepID=UPI001D0B9F49|nr:hypothetical protein [Streptomyces longhuiensis]UDM05454.1 hypothetical protein LGI35_45185 [Streptomyces longhuiensis]